ELDVIRQIDEKRGTDRKELHELINRLRDNLKRAQPAQSGDVRVWALDKDIAGADKEIRVWALDQDGVSGDKTIKVWAGDPKQSAGWTTKPPMNAFAVSQVDWKKLEQLLERL